ncbi:MAG: acyl carrier protein [Clostridia bacterium]|nr:acyl carrier protein [Clostridia bacterium]
MFEAVKEALAAQLRISADDITLDSEIKGDLGADSLDILQLLMTIEDEMGVTIPDEALAEFITVRDIVEYLEAHK